MRQEIQVPNDPSSDLKYKERDESTVKPSSLKCLLELEVLHLVKKGKLLFIFRVLKSNKE